MTTMWMMMPGTTQHAYPTIIKSIKNQGTGGRPSNVAFRCDWLVVRQLAVEKNWIARVTTSSPESFVCFVKGSALTFFS